MNVKAIQLVSDNGARKQNHMELIVGAVAKSQSNCILWIREVQRNFKANPVWRKYP